MAYVTVINEHQYVQQIVSGHHHLTADEAVAAGGSDAGLAPRELLLASLGACTAVALRKHAAHNDWALGKITVTPLTGKMKRKLTVRVFLLA